MLEDLNTELETYQNQWQELVASRNDPAFFEILQPVAVGWKVADANEYRRLYQELRQHCDQIVETWMNGRWIAKMHLHDTQLLWGIEVIKLMQRRPDSGDALGLDHVDFYSPEVARAEAVLQNEKDLKWTQESNEVVKDYNWISIWFNDKEAKLKTGTVIDIVVAELLETKQKMITKKDNA